MLIPILIVLGILCAGTALFILYLQHRLVMQGVVILDNGHNGPAQVSTTLNAVIRYLLKRSIHFRKFMMQYIAHLAVRVMYYVDIWSSKLYAKSRNWFVKNAVRNRGTVPHFWEHLKVYKQEMDKEKEDK